MELVPIPTTSEYLNATFFLWSPFLPAIAKRSPWSTDELLGKLFRHEVQPILIMNGDKAVALLGITIVEDDGTRIGELVWTTGARRADWQHLLTDLESYLRDHVKCRKCRPICRPGWQGFLEQQGYVQTGVTADKHVTMEKVL